MQWSNIGKWMVSLALAIFLGYLLGRQQQLFNGQRELQRQIDELKTPQKQARQPEPSNFDMKIDNAAIKGDPNARVTMIEFSDFECPYCGRYFRESYAKLDR